MELEYSDRNSRRSKVYIAVGVIVLIVAGFVIAHFLGGGAPAVC